MYKVHTVQTSRQLVMITADWDGALSSNVTCVKRTRWEGGKSSILLNLHTNPTFIRQVIGQAGHWPARGKEESWVQLWKMIQGNKLPTGARERHISTNECSFQILQSSGRPSEALGQWASK